MAAPYYEEQDLSGLRPCITGRESVFGVKSAFFTRTLHQCFMHENHNQMEKKQI